MPVNNRRERNTNRACMLIGPETVEIHDLPMPHVENDGVLVRVESTGICGSDVHNYVHGGFGKVVEEPLALGHESAGTVIEIGQDVTGLKVGDRVAIEPTKYCRKCHNCKVGKTNVCRTFKQASLAPTQGTLSQYYSCEADLLVKIPSNISWEVAGCIQPLAVAVQLAKRAKFSFGQTLAIFGCGPLGIMVAAVARAYGVSKILAFDVIPSRVEFIRTVGATYAAQPPAKAENQSYQDWAAEFKSLALSTAGVDEWGVDIVVEASGAEQCMHAGMDFVHNGGTYVQAGLGRFINSFPTFLIPAKEIDVIGTVRYTPGCFAIAIELLASGKIDLAPMITKVVPLTQSKEALEAVRSGKELKVVIMNQQ